MPSISIFSRAAVRRVIWLGLIPALAVCTADNAITSADADAALRKNGGTVASVLVQPGTATSEIGLTIQFTATPKDGNGNTITGQSVSWSSSDPAVLIVSSTGIATAVAAGSATITANVRGVKGTATALVQAAAQRAPGTVSNLSAFPTSATSVTLSFTQVDDGAGQPANYVVRYGPPAVTWGNATPVATGTCAGAISGTAIGSPLACTVDGLQGSTNYSFLVAAFRGTLDPNETFGSATSAPPVGTPAAPPAPPVTPVVTSVSVSPSSASIAVGATQTLSATARDQNGNVMTGLGVTWTSDNAAIASVNASVVTGVAAGGTTVRAFVAGIVGFSSITVNAPVTPPPPPAPSPVVTTVTVAPATATVAVGATQALSATVKDQNGSPMSGQAVTWSSSNNAIATVNASGVVTGVAAGSATITGTSSTKSGTASITVTAPAPPPPPPTPVATTVTVSPASNSVVVGGTVSLSATVKDQNGSTMTGQTVTWSSNGASVATVNASGVVTAVAAGSATITATSSGKTGAASITVTAAPPVATTVTVSPATATVVSGATVSLSATVKDQNGNTMSGQTVTWSTGNSARATVNSSGVVTGVSAGAVTITATSSGKTGTAAITVSAPAPVVTTVSVSPATASIAVGATQALAATVKDQNGATMTGQTVTWTSSASSIASVSGAGVVTGVAAGSATITASSGGQSGTASVTVTAVAPPPPPGVGDTVFFENWENNSFSKWTDGYNSATQKINSDGGAIGGSTRYLDVTYSPGTDAGWLNTWFMPGYDSLYMRMYVKLSNGWTGGTKITGFKGSRTDDKWSAYGAAGHCPTGTDNFAALVVTEVDGGTSTMSPPIRFYSYYAGMTPGSDGKCWGAYNNGAATTYTAPTQMSLGSWHKVEFWVKINTIGQSNGVQRIWIDGRLEGEWTGLTFRTSTILKLNSLPLTFSATNQSNQHMSIDDILVLTNRPSP